jgi:nicotinamidase-related amidase
MASDSATYEQQGFGRRVGMGERPALLVVDPIGLGFRPIVVRDCVGDRAIDPHDAALFDLDQKYADVLDADEVLASLEKGA